MNKTPEILMPALRQYRHNYGSNDFVSAYDEKETNAIIEQLQKELAQEKDNYDCAKTEADCLLADLQKVRKERDELIKALLRMADQYCTDIDGNISHDFMSAGENCESVLESLGKIKDGKLILDGVYDL